MVDEILSEPDHSSSNVPLQNEAQVKISKELITRCGTEVTAETACEEGRQPSVVHSNKVQKLPARNQQVIVDSFLRNTHD